MWHSRLSIIEVMFDVGVPPAELGCLVVFVVPCRTGL
jgi:hypothetical protein